ncbi:alpha-1,6-glucosidase domain-containing protein, partial [Xenorhabdus bovienii]|uniref:alpha-1,6-glucosidase domain-containing protein n=1 Tax=Xenorhabdus bovienii TaxID=40576 RepID=UPI0023B29FB1
TTFHDRDWRFDGLVVVINAAPWPVAVKELNINGLKLNDIQHKLGSNSLAAGVQIKGNGEVIMPAWSVAVLVLPQKGIRGKGIPVRKK